MGIGFALGGVAQGLQAADEMRARSRALDLRQSELAQNKDLATRSLAIQEKALSEKQRTDLMEKVDKAIANRMTVLTTAIQHGQQAGSSPEQIQKLIEPLVSEIESFGQLAGQDTSGVRNQVNTLLALPAAQAAPKVGSTAEGVLAKLSRGETLTPGEQQVLAIKQKQDALGAAIAHLIAGEGEDTIGAAATGEVPVTPVQTTTIPAPAAPAGAAPAPATAAHPPVPANLVGKAIAWSGKTQRFYDKAGNAYNQQGVPVPQ